MILDSDFLIAILRNEAAAIKKLERLEKEQKPLSTTTINAFELLKGAQLSAKKEENLKLVGELLNSLDILSFDFHASRIAAMLTQHLQQNGKTIDVMDIFIGSICVFHDESIITKNVRHFQNIPGLSIEEW
ncbi:type II toxin-antitoxin system VapC family toxin [Candidatus Woesearchaeota archaeon]|nr:type II toxin-antitoxin system VapC family toxin [Candidatus Woesearchaeota archaeon]